MKIQILSDLNVELNRLFIAGSKFAKCDVRIAKHLPMLDKMGEKSPVIKKLAEKITVLVNSQPEDSMVALSDAGTFLQSLLATQGEVSIDCEIVNIETETDFICSKFTTNTPHSKLRPIIDALTLSQSGNVKVINNAHKNGLMNDFRLYSYITNGIDSKNSELVQVLKEVIVSIGKILIPYILQGYDEKGKIGNAYRLELLGNLDYAKIDEMAHNAIENGSKDVVVVGIKLLARLPCNEKYLLTLADDKKQEYRSAALSTLVRMDSRPGKEMVIKKLSGYKFSCAVDAATIIYDDEFSIKVLNVVKSEYEKLFIHQNDAKLFAISKENFETIIECLSNKNQDSIYDFYKEVVLNGKYYQCTKKHERHYEYQNKIFEVICSTVSTFNAEKEFALIEEICSKLNVKHGWTSLLKCYANAAGNRQTARYSAKKLAEIFSPFYLQDFIKFSDLIKYNLSEADESMHEHLKQWYKHFIQKYDVQLMYFTILNLSDAKIIDRIRQGFIDYLQNKIGKNIDGHSTKMIAYFTENSTKSQIAVFAKIIYNLFITATSYSSKAFLDNISVDTARKIFDSDYLEKFKKLLENPDVKTKNEIVRMIEKLEQGDDANAK